jgi:hypothetical protein
MTDQELILDALEQARRILNDFIEPGPRRGPGSRSNRALAGGEIKLEIHHDDHDRKTPWMKAAAAGTATGKS